MIEGVDGSGKGTQTARLVRSLRDAGRSVEVFSFPRYAAGHYGELVGKYLNGDLGDHNDPHLVALLYAGDRQTAREELLRAARTHDFVVCDRYVSSNIAHQCPRVAPEREAGLRQWIEYVEYIVNDLPSPALQIMLDVPVEVAAQRILLKASRGYTDKAKDLHEADTAYLSRVIAAYRQLASGNSRWVTVTDDGVGGNTTQLVADKVFQAVKARVW